MKICGIIAEYNPLHSGHVYQIGKAKELTGCDYVVVCMSGDFVQRGLPAIVDKYERTRMALKCGADAVFELPSVYATASIKDFAKAGVSILSLIGCDYICFGAECGDIDFLKDAAAKVYRQEESNGNAIVSEIRSGKSYVKAIKIDDMGSNDRLAIEYINALRTYNYNTTPVCVKREGRYFDTDISSGSASAIRSELEKGNYSLVSEYMPCELDKDSLIFAKDFSDLYYAKLSLCVARADVMSLSSYMDVSANIEGHITNKLSVYSDIDSFAHLIHSGEYTRGRINRALLHILLDYDKKIYEGGVKPYSLYARLLGFVKNSAPVLSEIKGRTELPVVSKCADAKTLLAKEAYSLFEKDVFAANMYEYVAAKKQGRPSTDENAKTLILC